MSQIEIDLEIVVPSQTRYLALIGNIAEQIGRGLPDYSGDRDGLAYILNLVLTEAIANAIEHTGCNRAESSVRIHIHLKKNDLCIQVHDQGKGFKLGEAPCPEPESPRGRGLFFIRNFMDTVCYRKTDGGNVLEMRKRLD